MAWLVGVYLRETRRVNKDGSVVRYLQLAHNERHPRTGVPGREGDPQLRPCGQGGPARRWPGWSPRSRGSSTREQAVAAARAGEVEVLDSRRLGGAWVLGQLWERLEIGRRSGGWRRAGAGRGGYRAGDLRAGGAAGLEPALQAGRDPLGRRAGRDRRAARGSARTPRTRRWTSCWRRWSEIAAQIFGSVAHLLNLDVDIVFVDTTSTYWEVRGAPTSSPT